MQTSTLRGAPLRRTLTLVALVTCAAAPAAATTYIVDSSSDSPAQTSSTPDGTLTLREAVTAANTNAAFGDAPAGQAGGGIAGDVILFAAGVTSITLQQGEVQVTDDARIDGAGAVVIQPRTNAPTRIFSVLNFGGGAVAFEGLTLRGGYAYRLPFPTSTSEFGGAIAIFSGSVTVDGVTFDGNRAQEGGAIYVQADQALTISNSTFTRNRAFVDDPVAGGGALFVGSRVAVISTNNTFSRNLATLNRASGGAVFVDRGADFLDTGSTFSNNAASARGGAVELAGSSATATFTSSVFDGNRAGPSAASPDGVGGGVHGTGSSIIEMTLCEVRNNAATRQGGGVWVSSSGTLTVADTEFEDNLARGNPATDGGGAVYSSGGDVSVTGSTFTGNRATGEFASGGAILASRTASFEITDSVVGTTGADGGTGNAATRAGGGIAVREGSATLTNVMLGGNTAGVRAGAGSGGGLSAENETTLGTIAVLGSQILGNTAFANGGGIFIGVNNDLLIHETTVDGNTSGRNGGGLSVSRRPEIAAAPMLVSNSTFSNNSAADLGGGVAVFQPDQTILRNTTLSGNTARRGGGGYLVRGNLRLESVTIVGNAATANGGGFWSREAAWRVELQNTLVADNAAASGVQLSGFFASLGHNLVESRAGAGIAGQKPSDLYDVDAMLGPLTDNGGPTLTHALLAGSPGIDDGDTDLATDQRGEPRSAPHEIGAVDGGASAPAGKLGDAVAGLSPVTPNPVRTSGRVQFSVAQSETVTVELYDMMGRRVQSLYAGTPAAASVVDVTVDASGLASGVYVVVMQSETTRQTQRVTVAR